ncbi:hypothetical protein [Edaphobacter bradus]|uniref:hypothetical protein n=1 Tax=Edaphobacter bradus TaxID=2259016 RepID=UPI0021E00171|nr:hypothetical protein [Edaphobacter bradus]
MPDESSKRPWEERLHEAGSHIEEDLRRVIAYINDEVVPEVRRNGSEALRAAATELHKLAERIDSRRASAPPRPPKDVPKP